MMNDLIEEFRKELAEWDKNKLVSQYPAVTREDLKRDGVIIYGASVIAITIATLLLDFGIKPRWFVDKNELLYDTKISEIAIKPVESLRLAGESFVLLASTHIKELAESCERLGVRKYILPYALTPIIPIPCAMGKTLCGDVINEKLINTISLFQDTKSRSIYRQFFKYLYLYDNDFSRLNDPVQYFPDDLAKKIDYSAFVDCGAFRGDTLQTYIQKRNNNLHGEYFAFEPNAENFQELEKVAEAAQSCGIKVHLFNAGVGQKDCIAEVVGTGAGTVVTTGDNGNKITIRSLDSALEGYTPTCIKADVEGFERDLLLGAEEVIRKHKPTLIMSVYHKLEDIYEIPLWVDSLNLGYKIYLRHAPEVFTDTAMYAIVE